MFAADARATAAWTLTNGQLQKTWSDSTAGTSYGKLRQVTETEREELTRWSRSCTLATRDVFVALLILALADGKSCTVIERELSTSRPTIARWKARFEEGMARLEMRHQVSRLKCSGKRRSRPRMAAHTGPAGSWGGCLGSANRRCSGSGARQGQNRTGSERYIASDQPQFEEKAADIIGLYMDPPQHAAIFCVDEKTAIQAKRTTKGSAADSFCPDLSRKTSGMARQPNESALPPVLNSEGPAVPGDVAIRAAEYPK